MANIASYQQLQNLSQLNYAPYFAGVNQMQQLQIPQLGESIPKKSDGNLKYESSMTPLQKQKLLAITGLILSLLASVGVILAAILLSNTYIYFALLATGIGALSSLVATVYCFNKLDFNSPKIRREETEAIRTHKFTLSQINAR